jgi:starch-binding outer membrane protein, SusD/RagB family
MKNILFLSLFFLLIIIPSCTRVLDEDVRSQVVGSYLSTDKGFNDGVNAAYSSLRNIFCAIEDNGIIPILTTFGTDTYTNGFDGGFKMMNSYNSDVTLIPVLTRLPLTGIIFTLRSIPATL